jgi:hypothetical protein
MVRRRNLVTDAAPLLAGGLVEPGFDVVLPTLLEVAVGDDVVVLHHCLPYLHQTKPPDRRQNKKIDPKNAWRDDELRRTRGYLAVEPEEESERNGGGARVPEGGGGARWRVGWRGRGAPLGLGGRPILICSILLRQVGPFKLGAA